MNWSLSSNGGLGLFVERKYRGSQNEVPLVEMKRRRKERQVPHLMAQPKRHHLEQKRPFEDVDTRESSPDIGSPSCDIQLEFSIPRDKGNVSDMGSSFFTTKSRSGLNIIMTVRREAGSLRRIATIRVSYAMPHQSLGRGP